MGQAWKFFNISTLQYAEPRGQFKLGCIFYAKQLFLVRSLAMPYPVPELAGYLANAPCAGPIAKKGLLSLPDELLSMILSHGDLPMLDTVCLAITCKKLLTIAKGSLLKYSRDHGSASWAGCRIVCLGEYAKLDEAPESLFRPDLKEVMHKCLKAEDMEWIVNYFAGLTPGCRDATQRGMLYRGVHEYEHRQFVEKLPMPDRRLFVAAFGVTFPERDDWALFNTVKHEYVRAGALAELSGQPGDAQPFLRKCNADLGTALFTRFCYSPDNSTSMGNKSVGIHDGKWVGDRFVIDTIERVVQGDKEHEWKDVTDEVIADIKAIYRDDFDNDEEWERMVRKPQHGHDHTWFFKWDDEQTMVELLLTPEEQRRRELDIIHRRKKEELAKRRRKSI